VVVSGAWNALVKFGLPVLALALVAMQGDVTGKRLAAGVAGLTLLAAAVVAFALVFNKEHVARRAGKLAERAVSRIRRLRHRAAAPVEGWGAAMVEFRARAAELLRARWISITVAAMVSHLSLYLVLLVTLRHLGISDAEVGWAQVLAAFAVGRLLTIVRLTPGGAGATEAVLISALVAAGGEPVAVAAAVVVFRALTWLLPVPLGIVLYLVWRARRAPLFRRPVSELAQ
jgi:uncharacterized protein (TIRG00374 family)